MAKKDKAKLNQEEINQEEINQEEIDQEKIDQDKIDQDKIDQEQIDQEQNKITDDSKEETITINGKKEVMPAFIAIGWKIHQNSNK